MEGAVRKERVGRSLAMRIAWVRAGRIWRARSRCSLEWSAQASQMLASELRRKLVGVAKGEVFPVLNVPVALLHDAVRENFGSGWHPN